jgi:hypothetical protein
MTLPTPPVFTPSWLAPASVKDWLKVNATPDDLRDEDLIVRCCAAVEPLVERARSDQRVYHDPDDPNPPDPPPPGWPVVYTPDAQVYQAAVMQAGMIVRRRNSPGGLEAYGEGVIYVSRLDPDIARALHSGQSQRPDVG